MTADLEDPLGWQLEEPAGAVGAPDEQHEEVLEQRVHALDVTLDHRLATDEVGDLRRVERDAVDLDVRQGLGDVRFLHEAEVQDDLLDPGVELPDLAAILVPDAGDVSGDDGHEEGGGVQRGVNRERKGAFEGIGGMGGSMGPLLNGAWAYQT